MHTPIKTNSRLRCNSYQRWSQHRSKLLVLFIERILSLTNIAKGHNIVNAQIPLLWTWRTLTSFPRIDERHCWFLRVSFYSWSLLVLVRFATDSTLYGKYSQYQAEQAEKDRKRLSWNLRHCAGKSGATTSSLFSVMDSWCWTRRLIIGCDGIAVKTRWLRDEWWKKEVRLHKYQCTSKVVAVEALKKSIDFQNAPCSK
jgi:hypothetical protein